MKTKQVKVLIEDDNGDREEVIVFRKLTVGEFQMLTDSFQNKSEFDVGVELLKASIHKAPFAITDDNIRGLDPEVFVSLLDELEAWYGPLLERLKARSQMRSSYGGPTRPETPREQTSGSASEGSNSSPTDGPLGR